MSGIKIGQVWQCKDPRRAERHVKIVGVGDAYITVADTQTQRTVRINLTRFLKAHNGYTLVRDVKLAVEPNYYQATEGSDGILP